MAGLCPIVKEQKSKRDDWQLIDKIYYLLFCSQLPLPYISYNGVSPQKERE